MQQFLSARFGLATIVVLVALRLAIGWHFFQEGSSKLSSGKFSSVGFLQSAKGPLAPLYHGRIWDADGLHRLSLDSTLDSWNQFRQRLINHYGFAEDQAKKADQVFKYREGQLRWFFEENAEDLQQYRLGLERRDRNRADAARREVPSLRGQAEQIEAELVKKRGPWLADLDKLWKGYEADLNAIATGPQLNRGYFALPKPGRRMLDSEAVNKIIPYFDLLIGIALLLGLLTRVASVAAAGFLASVVASQWPGAEGAAPVYFQSVEMLALLLLAAAGAGRFAGLDFFLGFFYKNCCKRKPKARSQT